MISRIIHRLAIRGRRTHFLVARQAGYNLLSGKGLELGPFEHPAKLPSGCTVEYCDRISTQEAAKLFPEVNVRTLPNIQHIFDLDVDGLRQFADASYDFFIFTHVIEHLVNPIRALEEIMRVLKPGGKLAIAAPDKDFTFDRERPLSPFDRLRKRYEEKAFQTTPYDYYDVAKYNHPELMSLSPAELEPHLKVFESRREHLSIWTSESFRQFLAASFKLLNVNARPIYEVTGDDNSLEYFAIWEKANGAPEGAAK